MAAVESEGMDAQIDPVLRQSLGFLGGDHAFLFALEQVGGRHIGGPFDLCMVD